jgi:hypothetical protein
MQKEKKWKEKKKSINFCLFVEQEFIYSPILSQIYLIGYPLNTNDYYNNNLAKRIALKEQMRRRKIIRVVRKNTKEIAAGVLNRGKW